MLHATLADAQNECCELSSGNGPFRTAKWSSHVMISCPQFYECISRRRQSNTHKHTTPSRGPTSCLRHPINTPDTSCAKEHSICLRCVHMGRVTSSGQTSLHSTPAANAEPLLTYDTMAREDLRAHALWYLGLVVVFVVMVMALVRGGDGGPERWFTYVLLFPLDSWCAY